MVAGCFILYKFIFDKFSMSLKKNSEISYALHCNDMALITGNCSRSVADMTEYHVFPEKYF